MGANIHPSRIKAGIMTLTGTTSDGSTDIIKFVNSTGGTLGELDTSGKLRIKTMYVTSLPSNTGETNILYVNNDGKVSRGELIIPNTINAGNGLTKFGDVIILGGTLTGNTTIVDSRVIKTGVEYGGDYSDTFTNRSLIDKGYVEKFISDVLPIGANGNVFFINENNTRHTTPDYIVKLGSIVDNENDFNVAKGVIITFEDIFNDWEMFAHQFNNYTYLNANYLGQTISRLTATITGSGTTANVHLLRHGFKSGDTVTISGALPSVYNGNFIINVIDADNFNYTTLSAITSSPATGTIVTSYLIQTDDDSPTQSPRHFPSSDPLNTFSAYTVDDILNNNNIWSYDSINKKIFCTANYNGFTGFISNDSYSSYELSVVVSSTGEDDDMNGIIICYVVDENTGFEYTLSLVRIYNSTSAGFTYGIVYNYQQNIPTLDTYNSTYADSAQELLVNGSSLVTTLGGNWNVAGQTVMYVKRVDDIITVKVGQQGSSSLDDSTELIYDLKNNSKTDKFRGPSKIGFGSHSQAKSSFSNLNINIVNNYIFYITGGTYDTYHYNIDTTIWEKEIPQITTAHNYFGVGRLIYSELFNKLYFTKNDGTILKLTESNDTTQLMWTGNTVNGVSTYVNSNYICSNSGMTFNGSSLSVIGNINASTYICSPIITGSTCLHSPIICATTCFIGSGVGLTNTATGFTAGNACCMCYNSSIKACAVTDGLCLGSNCLRAYDVIATSDCRLKYDIQPITNALSIVNNLCGVYHKMCIDCNHECKIGLIAQDVKAVLPEIVSIGLPSSEEIVLGINDVVYGLKYDKITAVLIEAIKEQQKEINELKNKINTIKS